MENFELGQILSPSDTTSPWMNTPATITFNYNIANATKIPNYLSMVGFS